MHLEACIFDANSHHDPSRTIFLQLARHWLLFFENHKITPWRFFGWPGGMRGGAGGDFKGVRDLQATRQRLPTARAADRSAHSARPS